MDSHCNSPRETVRTNILFPSLCPCLLHVFPPPPSLLAGRDDIAYQPTVALLNLQIPGFGGGWWGGGSSSPPPPFDL